MEFDPVLRLLDSVVTQNHTNLSDTSSTHRMHSLRNLTADAEAIFEAAVQAVRSDFVMASQLHWDGRWLSIEDQHRVDLKNTRQLIIVGAGKASSGMLVGLLRALRNSNKPHPPLVGWINVPEGIPELDEPIPDSITVCQARPPGFNEPTHRVVSGTQEILKLVRGARPDDCTIALISGGGSALLCDPIDGITLQEKVQLTRALSGAGANIEQLNTVRRCLSNIKGGGLARACASRSLITCILSDVLGDPVEFIASGPTIVKPSADPIAAITILESLLPNQFPLVRKLLESQSVASREADSVWPDPQRPILVLANNASAVDAAGCKAVELGYRYWMKSEIRCEGSAEAVGQKLIQQVQTSLQDPQFDCIISGGEPTVRLPPADQRGLGGRNQQLALSALIQARESKLSESVDFCFLSGGTDGEDGPTDAAGAFVNNETLRQMVAFELNPVDFLQRCDAYHFFEKTGSLLKTGPTHTNVCDIRIALWKKKV